MIIFITYKVITWSYRFASRFPRFSCLENSIKAKIISNTTICTRKYQGLMENYEWALLEYFLECTQNPKVTEGFVHFQVRIVLLLEIAKILEITVIIKWEKWANKIRFARQVYSPYNYPDKRKWTLTKQRKWSNVSIIWKWLKWAISSGPDILNGNPILERAEMFFQKLAGYLVFFILS